MDGAACVVRVIIILPRNYPTCGNYLEGAGLLLNTDSIFRNAIKISIIFRCFRQKFNLRFEPTLSEIPMIFPLLVFTIVEKPSEAHS